METSYDIEKVLGNYSEKDLIKGIGGKLKSLSRVDAMELYLTKKPKDKNKLMQNVLEDTQQPYKLRLTAIQELGKEPTTENMEKLHSNLHTKDDRILSRLAKTLGKVGDKKTLNELKKVKVNSTSTAYHDIAFAKALIAYRNRLKDETLKQPAPTEILKMDARKAKRIGVRMANIRKMTDELNKSELPLLGLNVTAEGATQLNCQNEELLFTFNEQFKSGKDLTSMTKEKGIPFVLLKRRDCPEEYVLSHYFFTQPSKKKNEVIVTGVRPGGTVTYTGVINLGKKNFKLSLKTIKNQYSAAIQVDATYDYDMKEFNVDEALSSAVIDRKIPKKIPRKANFTD